MKKTILILLLFLFFWPSLASAQPEPAVYINVFYGDGCPHCHKEIDFLNRLSAEYPELVINYYEVWHSHENAKLMGDVAKKLNLKFSGGVPLTVIGDEVISGYLNDQTTGMRIRRVVESHRQTGCVDIVTQVKEENGQPVEECREDISPIVSLPILGEIDVRYWSLPVLTVVIAAIDGFNPCAMWVLIFLISLLLGMKDRRKMWLLGLTFIFSSGLVYFLFLSAWLNFFLFVGFISYVRLAIGSVAIMSGAYHLREFWSNRSGTCRVTGGQRRQKIMERLRSLVDNKSFILALIGIAGLAFAVNLVELVCSAGLPAIYTHILSLSDLNAWSYYGYLVLYILIFMLDDLAIFVIAMTTFQLAGISTKYTRWSNLFGGLIILALGILLIFRPGWIMFG